MLESRLRLLRQGHAVPAGDRPAQGVLRDRGARRRARDPREGDGQAAHPGPGARAAALPALLWLLDVPATTPRGRRSTRRSAASGRSTPSSGCSRARARRSRCCWSSRTCTGSTPRPRRCSTAWSRACPRPALLLLVNYRPEYQHGWGSKTYYTPAPPRPPAARERRASCSAALLGDDPSLAAAQAAADRAHRGQPVLPRGERPHAGRDGALAGERGAYRLAQAV